MSFFVNSQKVKAAARSMHQFCPVVRQVFRSNPVDNPVIEAATVYLYIMLARDVFGRRFTESMAAQMSECLKFLSSAELKLRLSRIRQNAERFRVQADELDLAGERQTDFQRFVRSNIKALLKEAGVEGLESGVVTESFPPFEETVRRIKTHLQGIKNQNKMLMR